MYFAMYPCEHQHHPPHVQVENEAVEQVAFADVLVLNKTDLVTPAELDAIKSQLRLINKGAMMMETQYGRVPVDSVLGIRAFDLNKTLAMDAGAARPLLAASLSHTLTHTLHRFSRRWGAPA
jgi:G3E family GTPase